MSETAGTANQVQAVPGSSAFAASREESSHWTGQRLDAGARTDLGRARANNEDCYGFLGSLGLFIVSDGMGGHADGEVASRMAVEAVASLCTQNHVSFPSDFIFNPQPNASEKITLLTQAVLWANQKIRLAASREPAHKGMGATLVAAWLDSPWLNVVNVGDSRAYLFRDGVLKQLTVDHSLVADQVRRGLITEDEAARSTSQSVLLRALGADENVDVDAHELLLMAGDVVLLCTDGLTRMVSDSEIVTTIRAQENAQATADRLVALANHHGGEDNVTVIVFRFDSGGKGILHRLYRWLCASRKS